MQFKAIFISNISHYVIEALVSKTNYFNILLIAALNALEENLNGWSAIDGIVAGIMISKNPKSVIQVMEKIKQMNKLAADLGLK